MGVESMTGGEVRGGKKQSQVYNLETGTQRGKVYCNVFDIHVFQLYSNNNICINLKVFERRTFKKVWEWMYVCV